MVNVLTKIPSTCPQPLADFIRFAGSKMEVRKLLHIGDTALNTAIAGRKPLPPIWVEQMEQLQNKAAAPPPPPVPEFVKWDGAMKTVIVPKRQGKKKRTVKGPSMVIELMEKNDLNISAAARAMNVSHGTVNGLVNGDVEFNERWQRRVFAALHGTPPTGLNGSFEELDRYTLDLAVVLVAAKNYDRVNDVAELLNGRVVFRMNTTAGWLLLYRMKGEDSAKFKRIVARDCQKITCP